MWEKQRADDDTTGTTDLLCRLLTRDEMREVWQSFGAEQDEESARRRQEFSRRIMWAYLGPHREERLTPRANEKLFKDIWGTARKLAALVRETSLEQWLWKDLQSKHVRDIASRAFLLFAGTDVPDRSKFYVPSEMSVMLERFAADVDEELKISVNLRPSRADAKRVYFIRSLTPYFQQVFPRKHADFLAKVATAALDLSNPIAASQVSRLRKKKKT